MPAYTTSTAKRSRRSRASAHSRHSSRPLHTDEEDCPFCAISRSNPPRSQISPYTAPSTASPTHNRETTHMILSTPQVIGFLDIMPLSPGHVLLTPRHHAEKIMDLTPEEGASLGAWLPIITRAVSRAMQVDDLNVVQNNGARASQVVKHVHYHIIPRPESHTASRAWTMFGKGQRSDLDDDEAALIAARIRQEIAWEMERMGNSTDAPVFRTTVLAPKL
ncbi:hypothetical protein TWF730_001085 [Orbilia blumenaviensis]|uniref:HIT domain-containing protein n=1 Tax=Orbilia blumenaviensis TaxID=1796055 RepID=A0AAV9VNL1_9PEZI